MVLSSLGCVGQSALVLVRPLSNEVLLEGILPLPSRLDRGEPFWSSTPLSFIIESRLLWWAREVACGEEERWTFANALEGELEREADDDWENAVEMERE